VNAQALGRSIPLNGIVSTPFTNIQWDPKTQSTLYAINHSGALIRINYLLRTERTVSEGPIRNYLVEAERIILLGESATGEPYLSWINPADRSTIHLLSGVEVAEDDALITSNSHYIVLKKPHTNTLLIIDPSIKPPLLESVAARIPQVAQLHFTRDGNTAVYSDGFGIYTRSFTTPISVLPRTEQKSALVTRYSKPIQELAVTNDVRHVFYTVAQELRVSELNASSDPRSTTLLKDVHTIADIQYLSRYNALTFIGEQGKLNVLALSLEDSGSGLFGGE